MPTLISGTPTNLEELRAIGEKTIAEGKETKEEGATIKEPIKEVKESELEKVKKEEPVIEVEKELKSFKFYDKDTGKTHTITERVKASIPTVRANNSGTWTIEYVSPVAYFSLDYGIESWMWAIHKLPCFSNKKLNVEPDSVITSEEVISGAIQTDTLPSITQAVFGGSTTAKYITLGLIGGLILVLLLKR